MVEAVAEVVTLVQYTRKIERKDFFLFEQGTECKPELLYFHFFLSNYQNKFCIFFSDSNFKWTSIKYVRFLEGVGSEAKAHA